MSDKQKISIDTDLFSAVFFAFLAFWAFSGWYRVDCALGIAKACELIAAEAVYSPPKPSSEPTP